jgi:hypothetical protein
MKDFRPAYDKINSTYGWKIQLLPEFDIRKIKDGSCIFDGYSKFINQPEIPNKTQLLLKCVDSLFQNKWIEKSSKLAIYKTNEFFRYPVESNILVMWFKLDNGIIVGKGDADHVNPLVEKFVLSLVNRENENREQILKVVK